MKQAKFGIFLCLAGLVSCDKAKDLAQTASESVRDKMGEVVSGVSSGGKVDPELAELVDGDELGARFRKDLPFPRSLVVEVAERRQLDVRVFEASAIGKSSTPLKAALVSSSQIEFDGDQLQYTVGEFQLTDPTAEDSEGRPQVIENNPFRTLGSGSTRTFRRTGGAWRADESSGFAAVSQSRDLAPVFDLLLQDHGLVAPPVWFGPDRIEVGSSLTVAGDSLRMLFGGVIKGRLTLTLEAFEGVGGHPCGVFQVKGDFTRRQSPSFDGQFTDEEVTIDHGRIWCSLIQPVVLKSDLETVRTFQSGPKGAGGTRGQGKVKAVRTLLWKPQGTPPLSP